MNDSLAKKLVDSSAFNFTDLFAPGEVLRPSAE